MKKLFFAMWAMLLCCSTIALAQGKGTRASLIETALKYRGVPYVYGAESPQAFDCSGFVRYVYREALGIELPRSARSYTSSGESLDPRDARAGDIFIYDTVGGAPSHVSLYIGDGTVIHAVSEGPKTGVIVSAIDDRYWAQRIIGARSFLGSGTAKPSQAASPESKGASKGTPKETPRANPAPMGTPKSEPVSMDMDSYHKAIVEIGVSLTTEKSSFSDSIPTMVGTSVSFTLSNDTGKDGAFMVLFFRIDPVSYKLVQIHEEKVSLRSKAVISLPPFSFDAVGKHKLVVKDSWGNQVIVREFTVTKRSP